MSEQDQFISYAEASQLLGVPVGTLYAWVCRRSIPHLRYGTRMVRFSRSALKSWIDARSVEEAKDRNSAKGILTGGVEGSKAETTGNNKSDGNDKDSMPSRNGNDK